jgi:Na+/H+ antiporter NhaD/arsenite permease-like protein
MTLSLIPIIGLIIFIIGYAGIAFEHKTHINKAAWALFTGGALWLLVALQDYTVIEEKMLHAGYEIFSITLFLLAAMSLVEILIACGVFDLLRQKMLSYKLDNIKQFMIFLGLAFVLSGIIDNLTATIILIQIARKFFKGENLLIAGVGIVVAANAGGALSPIGDITTIMLWIAGKFSAIEIITRGFLPSLTIFLVASFFFLRKMGHADDDTLPSEAVNPLTWERKVIVGITLLSFFMPIAAKALHLPPVSGILFGLGIAWITVDLLQARRAKGTQFSENMDTLLQKTDISSIKFFVGILLAVSALEALGILSSISEYIYGAAQTDSRVITGNILMGMISSILDNIPLTAIAINILEVTDTNLWVLLAISVGTGGSLLAIGSAAGVVAMGILKDLTFKKYFDIAFIPALVGYFAGISVWWIQTVLFFS